jgi:hypothetical protein
MLSAIDDGNLTTVVLNHELGDLIERSFWSATGGIGGHHVASQLSHSSS